MRNLGVLGLAALALGLGCASAQAGDWSVVRLRGGVFALDGQKNWTPVLVGDVISDRRMIETAGNGRVTFQREGQTIDLGPGTLAQIIDFAADSKTTVWEHRGTVGIEAEARDVQHFSVQTPYLAAVVKGTRFTVSSDSDGSTVDVTRGRVEVRDTEHGLSVGVPAGQSASVAQDRAIEVSGPGPKEPIRSLDGAIHSHGGNRADTSGATHGNSGEPNHRSDRADRSSDGGSGNGHGNGGSGGNEGGKGGSDSGRGDSKPSHYEASNESRIEADADSGQGGNTSHEGSGSGHHSGD